MWRSTPWWPESCGIWSERFGGVKYLSIPLNLWMGVFDPCARLWTRQFVVGTVYQMPVQHHELFRIAARRGAMMRWYRDGDTNFVLPGTGAIYELLSFEVNPVVLVAVRGPIPRQERQDLEMDLYEVIENLSDAVDRVLRERDKALRGGVTL